VNSKLVTDNSNSLLIVTPARNESSNIQKLAQSLSLQIYSNILLWVIVNDGSTDDTLSIAENLQVPFSKLVINRKKEGSLITGAAFAAWWQGVDSALNLVPDVRYVMKLDADVSLENNYFHALFKDLDEQRLGVLGGVIQGMQKEQKTYVPGPVKMYSRAGLAKVRELPIATGFDVMDEILCKSEGLKVVVVPDAKFSMNRQIGHSQGLLHGRFRNGVVCRWIGYDKAYFALHAFRYIFRKPYLLGSFWMLMGFLRGGSGPYASNLRQIHGKIQREKMVLLVKNPVKTLRKLYF
jgi:dolichol-phosphate mannosyltransferase